jgi:hypothetical protein
MYKYDMILGRQAEAVSLHFVQGKERVGLSAILNGGETAISDPAFSVTCLPPQPLQPMPAGPTSIIGGYGLSPDVASLLGVHLGDAWESVSHLVQLWELENNSLPLNRPCSGRLRQSEGIH